MHDQLLVPRLQNRRIYDLAAPFYDFVSACIPWERGLRERAVARLGAAEGSRILDVGCGTGLCLPALARMVGTAGSVVGIDPSAASLDRASRRAQRLGCAFTAVIGDAAGHEFPSAVFDGAIAVFSISVIPAWERALARIHAALKAGAVLVVLEQRYPSRSGIAGRLGAKMNSLLGADPERDFVGALTATGFTVETHSLRRGWYAIYTAVRT
jgi:ubiquinone/menaquinone biosynthesis C-methylase UbiE